MSTDKDLTQVYRSLPHGQRRESVRASVKERFWAKVAKGEGCWNWTASLSSTGYGQFSIRHRPYLAHRLVYQMTRGPIPKGMQIDHREEAQVLRRNGQPCLFYRKARYSSTSRVSSGSGQR